jgi:hypothetical protein
MYMFNILDVVALDKYIEPLKTSKHKNNNRAKHSKNISTSFSASGYP